MKRLLLSLLLLASPALGATYHVMVGGTCPNHPTVLGGACSSLSTCGAEATPCCSIQDADNKTLIAGDIVTIHEATYTLTPLTSADGSCIGGSGVSFPSNCCQGESCCGGSNFGAYIQRSGSIWRVGAGDDVILDYNNVVQSICIDALNVEWDASPGTWTLTNKLDTASARTGVIETAHGQSGALHSTYPEAANFWLHGGHHIIMPNSTNFGPSSFEGNICLRLEGNGHLIEDFYCEGKMGNGVYLGDAVFFDGNAGGMVIRDFTIESWANNPMAFTPINTRLATNIEPVLIYNGVLKQLATVDARGTYTRENNYPVYMFNLRFLNMTNKGLNLQDNVDIDSSPCTYATEDLWVFNSTFVGDGGTSYALEWPNYFSSARFVNNIFSQFGTNPITWSTAGTTCGAHSNGVTDQLRSSSTDHFDYNLCYNGLCNTTGTAAPTFTSNPSPANPLLNSDGSLQAGSPAIGVGNNDPLAFGTPGLCTITVEVLGSPLVIDCSLDIDGTDRGTTWDIGADQFVATVPLPGLAITPDPGNGAGSVTIDPVLSWVAGSDATSHDVYFGTDDTPDAGEFIGNQAGLTYDPGTLVNSTTYYWRIDEVNATGTTTGTVWSFTTTPPQPTSHKANGVTGRGVRM